MKFTLLLYTVGKVVSNVWVTEIISPLAAVSTAVHCREKTDRRWKGRCITSSNHQNSIF